MREWLEKGTDVPVRDAEYRRLLGYPRDHELGERALELMAWVRGWFAEHKQAWTYLREVEIRMDNSCLAIDGHEFRSEQLYAHFRRAGVERAMLVAVSAGPDAEVCARSLWESGKPDEYFFLETYGAAVVEELIASVNARICAMAESRGLQAIRHYSPGYGDWDVAEQNPLFDLLEAGARRAFGGPLEVLPSGMLRPKQSQLALVGLASRDVSPAPRVPCRSCSFSPCQYRRVPYRFAQTSLAIASPRVASQS